MPETQSIDAGRVLPNTSRLIEGFDLPFSASLPGDSAPWVRQVPRPSGELLLVGRDETLQGTRISLLERVGLRCRSVADMGSLSSGHNQYRLVILCHSLSVPEAYQVVEQVTVSSPATVILRLLKCGRNEEACFPHVLVAPTPDRLVATVQHLIAGCPILL